MAARETVSSSRLALIYPRTSRGFFCAIKKPGACPGFSFIVLKSQEREVERIRGRFLDESGLTLIEIPGLDGLSDLPHELVDVALL